MADLKIKLIGGSINQVRKPQIQSELQKRIPNNPIESLSISKGSIIIIVSSSSEGINELCTQYQSGLLTEICGFSIESLKVLNNQAVKTDAEKNLFTREFVRTIRDKGFLNKLPDIRDMVEKSFTMSSNEIMDYLGANLNSQSSDLNFQTRSDSTRTDTKEEFLSKDNVEGELLDELSKRILDFRSK